MTESNYGLYAGALRLNNAEVKLSLLPMHVTYFEHVPSVAHLNGIIEVALAVGGTVSAGTGSQVNTIAALVTHLKCNVPAALALRDALNNALLLAQPAAEDGGKAN